MYRHILLLLLMVFLVGSEKDFLCSLTGGFCEVAPGSPLIFRVPTSQNISMDSFRTHSLHTVLTYLHHIKLDVSLTVCGELENNFCDYFRESDFHYILYRDLESHGSQLRLLKKNEKYFVPEIELTNFLRNYDFDKRFIPTIVLSSLLSSKSYRSFIMEIHFFGKERFSIHYHHHLSQEYPTIKEYFDDIVMYNTFKCTDSSSISSCERSNFQVDTMQEINTFDILCKFSKDLLQNKNKIVDTRFSSNDHDRKMVHEYISRFCKRLLFIIYESDEEDKVRESIVDDIVNTLDIYESLPIKINRYDFETSMPREWKLPSTNEPRNIMMVLCGPNLNKCTVLTENIFSINKQINRTKLEETFMDVINQIEYKDYQMIETREKLFCYSVLGDCYDIFKYIHLQIFYDYHDRIEKDEYYRIKKSIIVKIYYMIWSVTSLRTLKLYESLFNHTEETSILKLIGKDFKDLQLIRINCLEFNEECNKEEIISYPTIKITFRKKGRTSFTYKRDPLDRNQFIRFIINCAINPFFYSKWKSEEQLFLNIIKEYYENIIIVGLWQNLDIPVRTNVQTLLTRVEEEYFILVLDVESPPSFIKNLFLFDIKENPGVYIVNIRHVIVQKIIVQNNLEFGYREFKKISVSMLDKLSLERCHKAKKAKIPIFVIFYYKIDFQLESIMSQCYHSFVKELSFNHVNIWQNFKMYQLFEKYKCKTTPCFSVFNHSASVFTFQETIADLASIHRWLQNILDHSIVPNVIMEKSPTMEFFDKFDYVDSFDAKKSVFECNTCLSVLIIRDYDII